MTNYNRLSDLIVQGKVSTSSQGDLIGSKTTMPSASESSGMTIMYLGTTTSEFTKGSIYTSNGISWSKISVGSDVQVDSNLDKSSLNAIQNKAVATRFESVDAELGNKVEKVSGKGLSTNDYTSAEKTKLGGISSGAQVNTIEIISVNGTNIAPVSKTVNIDLSGYATKSDITKIPKFAILVVDDLPTSGISDTTIYLKPNSGSGTNIYNEYIHVNGKWELIGTTETDLSGYALKTEVQAKQDKVIFAQNVSVSWASDTSVAGYSYKGTAIVSGMTSLHEPSVCFDHTEAVSGLYSPSAESDAGKVYVWSKDNSAVTIPVITGVLKS